MKTRTKENGSKSLQFFLSLFSVPFLLLAFCLLLGSFRTIKLSSVFPKFRKSKSGISTHDSGHGRCVHSQVHCSAFVNTE